MPFRFVNLPRVAVLEVVRWCRWCPAGAGAVHFRRILQEKRPPPGCFPFHIVLICKQMLQFLQVLFHFPPFAPGFGEILRLWLFWSGPAAVCRMVGAWSRGTRRRCRSPSVNCSARNIGRRATLLPSPRRCSFLLVSASRWWSPSFSVVLLLRVSRWGFWCSFLLRWVWLYTGVYSSLFNRARNKRARTREGLPLLFPASLPSVGLLTAFFFGGRCRGIPSTPGKRGGAFLPVFYISGGIVKNLHGHKISTAGAVLVPSWRCWFKLLRLSVLGQAVTISAGLGLPWKSPAHA